MSHENTVGIVRKCSTHFMQHSKLRDASCVMQHTQYACVQQRPRQGDALFVLCCKVNYWQCITKVWQFVINNARAQVRAALLALLWDALLAFFCEVDISGSVLQATAMISRCVCAQVQATTMDALLAFFVRSTHQQVQYYKQ